MFTGRNGKIFSSGYSVSLAVIAVGLVAAFFIPALGSPVNWISRVMQYIGADSHWSR